MDEDALGGVLDEPSVEIHGRRQLRRAGLHPRFYLGIGEPFQKEPRHQGAQPLFHGHGSPEDHADAVGRAVVRQLHGRAA